MALKLHGIEASAAVRGTLLAVRALGLQVQFVEVNILIGDQLTPRYLALNPLHTVPTLEDDGYVLWDSHAINAYLVSKYGGDDALYPRDLEKRAVVDQRMYFDCGVLFPRVSSIVLPLLRESKKNIDKDKATQLIEDPEVKQGVTKMVIKLYGVDPSIGVRSVLLTLKALGLEYELIEVNVLQGDQLKPEFLKLNPLHTVPTIEDDDFVLWESYAIIAYLVGKYGEDDALYPKDFRKRAIVDNRMYFACGVFIPKYGVVASLFRNGPAKIKNEQAAVLIEEGSPGVRAVFLTSQALGIAIEFKAVDLGAGEHLTPGFLKMNPLHTVPTLQDGDFAIWDSHAINAYLTEKYGKDDALYPKNLQKRAVVDQRLYFDCGVLFPKFLDVLLPVYKDNESSVYSENAEKLIEAYGQLETLLELNTYVAGDTLTIADFSVIATVTSANVLVPIAANRFPKITEWISKMQALPYYEEANQKGLDKFAGLIKSRLA
ncbi:hypothetical protein NQ318_004387 [Aromia moschata]|uniref:Glutathione transferase n=1 Tax=Aromia moschata TaxID=1265417 RepID=A0AAV8YQU1_9CUCU|nr:hypothetical protein NQ318_004387 [Aromia moschata]